MRRNNLDNAQIAVGGVYIVVIQRWGEGNLQVAIVDSAQSRREYGEEGEAPTVR